MQSGYFNIFVPSGTPSYSLKGIFHSAESRISQAQAYFTDLQSKSISLV